MRPEGYGTTAVVLGAGGVLGAAWLTGVLRALEEVTGFDPRTADHLLGTSAGSIMAAALGAGVDTNALLHHQFGLVLDGAPQIDFDPDVDSGGRLPPWPKPRIGSPELLLNSWRHPGQVHPQVAMYSVVPEGRGDLEPVGRLIDSVNAAEWSPHPSCRVVAVDYEEGRRTVFGDKDAPPARLRAAVMASCAVPGWYHPVRIDGRRYVDGGVRSSTSADLLVEVAPDRVYVLAPMASYEFDKPRSVGAAFERGMRRFITRGLSAEVARLRAAGSEVTVLTPVAADLEVIGPNLMNPARRTEVLETALRTMTQRLEADELVGDL